MNNKHNALNTSAPNSLNSQSKDNKFKTELKTIFEYLKENVCTASMLSEATGVKQKNICSATMTYVSRWHQCHLPKNVRLA